MENKNSPEIDNQVAETEEIELAMMCWERSENSLEKEPYEESDDNIKKPDKETQKPKGEEEHVGSTLHTGN